MSFTLSIAGSNIGTFTSLGADGLKMNLRSQESSVFKFCLDGTAMDAAALTLSGEQFDAQAVGKVCQVFNGETCIFSGRLFRIPRSGSGAVEKIDYEIRDPWEQLKDVVYQQVWTIMLSRDENGNIVPGPSALSRLTLGQDAEGNQVTGAQIIEDVIAWAASCGALVQVGTIIAPAQIPFDDVTDLTCSEVIKRVLRWMPDASTWFDYTQTPPAFNCAPRANLAALTLPFTGAVEQQDIQAMPELLAPVVVINYVQENTSNIGPTGVTVFTDLWPEGQSPEQLKAMVMTCELAGSKSTYQQQPVVCLQPLPTDDSANDDGGPADDPTIQWWQRKIGWLLNLGDNDFSAADVADQLVIKDISAVYQKGQPGDDGSGGVAVDFGIYPNELLTGSIAQWMDVKVSQITVTAATIVYSYPSSTADYSDQDWTATQIFGPDDGSGFSSPFTLSANATATSAVTQTYTQLTGYTAPEPVPVGLAQQIYNSVAAMQYEGSYTTVSQEIGAVSLGIVVNLTGGRTEWETMNALVQEIECDLDKGKVTFKFSQHGHLGLQDLMELVRMNRQRVVSARYASRTTGQADSSQPVIGPSAGSSSGGAASPSAGPPWINSVYVQDTMSRVGLTWAALFGFGESDFVGNDSGQIGQAQPLEKLEIAVGYGDWTGPIYNGDTLKNQLSIISGNNDAADDEIRIWGDSYGSLGSASLIPCAASVYISNNRQPSDDTDDDQWAYLSALELNINGSATQNAILNTGSLVIQYSDTVSSTLFAYAELFLVSGGSYASLLPDVFSMENAAGTFLQVNTSNSGSALLQLWAGDSGGNIQLDVSSEPFIQIDNNAGGTVTLGALGLLISNTTGGLSISPPTGSHSLQKIDLTSIGGPTFYAFQ
jgi:hypothetical protein